MASLKKYAVIVAGGSGQRMLSTVPKQFLVLVDKPVLMHTLRQFAEADSSIEIILALPATQIHFWKQLCLEYSFEIPHLIVEGGTTRFHTVKNALEKISGEGLVAVHDGVRPLVAIETIREAFAVAAAKGNAVPVTPVNESLRFTSDGKNKAVDRMAYSTVQTPQCFLVSVLQQGYEQEFRDVFTDDASVVEALGYEINLTNGDPRNIKITTATDFLLAEGLVKALRSNL